MALFTLLSMSGSYIRAGAAGNDINSHQEPPPAITYDGEALPPVPEVVRLSWDNLPNPDAELEATARAFLPDQTQYRQTDSPALYFHPTTIGDASALTFYGEKTLMERFNAGDFRGQLSEREIIEASSVTTRAKFGGSRKPTDAISEDDPGEPTEPDDDESKTLLKSARASCFTMRRAY